MSRGASGKIVLEVSPSLKNDLYGVLGQQNKTLKGWFMEQAAAYVESQRQPTLPFFSNHPASKHSSIKK